MPKQTSETYTARAEYLAGYPGRLGTVTIDPDLFSAADNGDVVLQPGTVLAKPSATDLWGPYDSEASDGRETATNNVLVLHDYVEIPEADISDVNKEIAVLLEGLANGAKVILEDGTEASTAIRDALRSRICDVQFDVGT